MMRFNLFFFGAIWPLALIAPALAYNANGRWTTTASGPVGPLGTPVTLTWSFVPDGTFMQGAGGNSDLISSLDTWFGEGPGGADLSQRPWFSQFEQSFDRWEELGGVTFVYQPADDGVNHGSLQGNNLRGDIRFGGKTVDGVGGTYASAWFIPNSDITLDTADATHFTDPASNYRSFRNTMTHEIGHALGLGHVNPLAENFLMEGDYSGLYDGPQFDDIRGIQYQYGDIYEKSNGNLGNNSIEHATQLGTILPGNSAVVGGDGLTGIRVASTEDDFVSISTASDVDFFSFTITEPSLLSMELLPVGPTYTQRILPGPTISITSASISDLNLELYEVVAGSASLLASVNANPVGQSELIEDFALEKAGEYFVRVAGSAMDVQLYRLTLGVETWDIGQPGDFDDDGDVDGQDFLLWQRGLSPNVLSETDLAAWHDNYGANPGISAFTNVPEPGTLLMLAPWMSAVAGLRRCRLLMVS